MKITALEPQAANAERVNVYVDGRFLMGVSATVILQMGLELEQELQPAQLEELRGEEALQQAVERAYNYLSYRPRSREEVRRYLRRKETPPNIIDSALARLDRLDLVNDHTFASFWAENREQFSPRGARAIKNELRMKGSSARWLMRSSVMRRMRSLRCVPVARRLSRWCIIRRW